MKKTDRREFIISGAAAVAVATLSNSTALAAAEPKRKMTMDLICGRLGVKANQEQAIDFAAQHGFESVGPNAGELAKLSSAQLQEMKGRLKEKGLVFSAAGMPVDFRGGEEKFKTGLAALPAEAAVLQKAGVTRVGTWLKPYSDDLTYLQNFRQHGIRLREVGKILADHGLRFGLEYVGPKTLWASKKYAFVHSMAETKDLLSEINVPSVGFVLDSWHWYTAHENKDDLLSLSNEQIVAVDLNDAPKGLEIDAQIDNQRELPATTGVIDVATFLRALNQLGYDGPVRAEPFNAPLRKLPAQQAVAKTAAAMKKAFAMI
ncbi:MAG: sugar phosphate isomerase/epimerase [Verrucomicrobiales bacterium]|nr:sugar phosphate isomerase/epimerase [Verrucomicrobiales bacterium]